MRMMKIGFYGMTHLGLLSLVAAASKECAVIGYDEDSVLIQKLQKKMYPIVEPDFEELINHYAKCICFASQIEELLHVDLIYISIDVPTDVENRSNIEPINDALKNLRKLKIQQPVIILSQVHPGFLRAAQWSACQLFYQVETLIFGRGVQRATQPERFIIGCANPKQNLPDAYHKFLEKFNCPILIMRYESAELAKLAINMYLVSMVMTSNWLAQLAATLGADWREIIPALRLDQRIGMHAYLEPGLGISGGNLERDMMTLTQVCEKNYVSTAQIKQWTLDSEYYKNWIWRCLQETVFSHKRDPIIAILGLSYKANTHSIKNSPSLVLIESLKKTNAIIKVHDPVINAVSITAVLMNDSVLETVREADAVIFMVPWDNYKTLPADVLADYMQGRAIIDPYRLLNHTDFLQYGFHIYQLGIDWNRQHALQERCHV